MAVSSPMAEYIRNKANKEVFVVYNGVTRKDLKNAERFRLLSEKEKFLDNKRPFKIFYAGNFPFNKL